MKNRMGLYVHIPFCQKRCHYCDFLTFEHQEDRMDQYVDYLIKEIQLYQNKDYTLDTIYFGGGTPSYLSSQQITRIMNTIGETFNLLDDCETTIEMNPESVTEEKVRRYLELGINRFSMGVQTFNDAVLKTMGRLHNQASVFEKMALLKRLGCKNISIDLMFANPEQDMSILKKDIELALSLKINHLSIYSLMIKEKTLFYSWVRTGKIHLYDDDIERDMYHYIQKTLKNHGFHQYEISSFARGEAESRHNKKYWQLKDYLGVGMGASSNVGLVRSTNHRRFDKYFEMIDQGILPVLLSESISMEDREHEYIMLNMRLIKGFSIEDINQKFGIDFLKKYQYAIDKHTKNGVIRISDGRVFFTDFGLDVGNQFYLDIL